MKCTYTYILYKVQITKNDSFVYKLLTRAFKQFSIKAFYGAICAQLYRKQK